MNRKNLSLLFLRSHNAQSSVLSVYLNVDQSEASNLSRSFGARLKRLANAIRRTIADAPERERFTAALHHVQDYLSAYSPSAKSLLLFFDTTDGFFWHEEADFRVSDRVRWGNELYLEPLAAAQDQLEAYGVVLVDRAKWRLFVVSLGKIRETAHQELDNKKVRHIKTAGTDHLDSSSRIQRKADNQVRQNLRELAKELERVAKSEKLRRFVLAGTSQATAEFRNLLPARLALNVIGEVPIASNAAAFEVLASTEPVADKYERDSEVEKVNSVVTSATKRGKAVVGLGSTLKAVNSDRVWELIYSGDLLARGYECPKCGALFSARPSRCTYCSSRLQPVTNVVQRAVEHALRKQAKVEVVTGAASALLKTAAGGIGAFLKTRTGSLEA